MSNQDQKKLVPEPDSPNDNPGVPNRLTEGGGVRQYESGRNPDMQVQRSNRQGSGQPTQQRREDR